MSTPFTTLLGIPLVMQFFLTACFGVAWLIASHFDEYYRASWRPRAIYSYLAFGFGALAAGLLLSLILEIVQRPSRQHWITLVSIGVGWLCVHLLAQKISRSALANVPFDEEHKGSVPDSPYKHHGI